MPGRGRSIVVRLRGALTPSKRRVLVGFADQGLSSLQNFILFILVARAVTPTSFGAFAICFSVITLLFGFEQAMLSDPLLIIHSASADHDARNRATGYTLTAAAAVGGLGAVVAAPAALLLPGELRGLMWALAVTAVPLLTHDVLRFASLAEGRPGRALALDSLWVALWIAAEATVWGSHSPVVAWLAWGVPCFVTSVVGCVILRVRLGGIRGSLREMIGLRQLTLPLLADFTAANVIGQVVTVAMGGFVGLAAVGGFRAAQALLGPVATLANACRIVFIPELARADVRSERGRRVLMRLNALVCAVVLVFCLAALAIPDHIGRDLFGATWRYTTPPLLAVAVSRILGAFAVAPAAALRALRDSRSIAKTRMVVSVVTLAAVLPGLLARSVVGCAWGLAFASAALAIGYWAALRRSLDAQLEGGVHLD
jgi:O-antigen/teichoic acid export membrane protein